MKVQGRVCRIATVHEEKFHEYEYHKPRNLGATSKRSGPFTQAISHSNGGKFGGKSFENH